MNKNTSQTKAVRPSKAARLNELPKPKSFAENLMSMLVK